MKYKCCVCDLDGTVLNPQSRISEQDKLALLALRDKGVKLILATGRAELQILEFLDTLCIDTPVITCNGGMVRDRSDGELIHLSRFQPGAVEKIVKSSIERGYDFLLYTPDYIYHAENSKRIEFFVNYNKTALPCHRVPIRHVKELCDYENVSKVLINHDVSILGELEREYNSDGSITLVSSGKGLIDIMPANTSKGVALVKAVGKLGIPPEQTVAFGDSPNDAPMLRAAGYSVAMGNAVEELRSIADFVTLTNAEGGVAHALSRIF